MPTINNLVQRYFSIFTWHSKKDLVIGWGGFNSLFDYPGLHIFIQTCHLTYCEINYKKEQISSKNVIYKVILKTQTTHHNKQLKIVTFHSNYPCRKRHLHIYLTTMCPCLSSTSTGVCFQHLSFLDTNVISYHHMNQIDK